MLDLKALEHLFERYGLSDELKEQRPVFVWRQVVGELIARRTCPLYVMNGVLYVEAATPVIAQELSLMKGDYIKRINEVLGEVCIRDIKPKAPEQTHEDSRLIDPIDFQHAPLLDDEREQIQKITAAITNDQLREALERFLITLKKLEKARQRLGWKRCPNCGVFHDGDGTLCFNCEYES